MMSREIIFILLVLATIQGQIRILEGGNLGVNYEISGDNLPSPADAIALLKKYKIDNVRLFDSNPAVLNALKGSGIKVILGIKNEDIEKPSSIESAEAWLDINVKPYINSVNFSLICVGNEAIPGNLTGSVLHAIRSLDLALATYNYTGIKVTTVVSTSVLTTLHRPSASEFTKEAKINMISLLNTITYMASPLLINAYPYYALIANPKTIELDYAQFTAPGPVVKDGNLSYQNLLDALVDSFYSAMEKVHVPGAKIIVAESGWPYEGNGNNTTVELAQTYNRNFRKRILSNAGTPKEPIIPLKGFIYSMFDNNRKPKGAEQHFGIFHPNGNPVYTVF